MRLLLISNGNDAERGYLGHARPQLDELLSDARNVVFVPYAMVTRSFDDYTELVARALGAHRSVVGLHSCAEPQQAVSDAEALLVGGGNTWQLLRTLRDLDLIDTIRDAARDGTPYAGWSAGANVACPTISTTNDMSIVDPRGTDALGLVPFQINPHFTHAMPDGFNGETREQRIVEYLTVNRDVTVAGLREGTMLRITDDRVDLLGDAPCRVFSPDADRITIDEVEPGDDLTQLGPVR